MATPRTRDSRTLISPFPLWACVMQSTACNAKPCAEWCNTASTRNYEIDRRKLEGVLHPPRRPCGSVTVTCQPAISQSHVGLQEDTLHSIHNTPYLLAGKVVDIPSNCMPVSSQDNAKDRSVNLGRIYERKTRSESGPNPDLSADLAIPCLGRSVCAWSHTGHGVVSAHTLPLPLVRHFLSRTVTVCVPAPLHIAKY